MKELNAEDSSSSKNDEGHVSFRIKSNFIDLADFYEQKLATEREQKAIAEQQKILKKVNKEKAKEQADKKLKEKIASAIVEDYIKVFNRKTCLNYAYMWKPGWTTYDIVKRKLPILKDNSYFCTKNAYDIETLVQEKLPYMPGGKLRKRYRFDAHGGKERIVFDNLIQIDSITESHQRHGLCICVGCSDGRM